MKKETSTRWTGITDGRLAEYDREGIYCEEHKDSSRGVE